MSLYPVKECVGAAGGKDTMESNYGPAKFSPLASVFRNLALHEGLFPFIILQSVWFWLGRRLYNRPLREGRVLEASNESFGEIRVLDH